MRTNCLPISSYGFLNVFKHSFSLTPTLFILYYRFTNPFQYSVLCNDCTFLIIQLPQNSIEIFPHKVMHLVSTSEFFYLCFYKCKQARQGKFEPIYLGLAHWIWHIWIWLHLLIGNLVGKSSEDLSTSIKFWQIQATQNQVIWSFLNGPFPNSYCLFCLWNAVIM